MSTQPPKKSSIPLPAVIGILVVAIAAVLYQFVLPMLSGDGSSTDSATIPPMPPGPSSPGMPPAPPTAATPSAPAPGMPSPTPPAAGSAAPTASAPPTPSPTAAPSAGALVPTQGEIVVNGTVTSVKSGGNVFTIKATSIVLPGKGKIVLSPPRAKKIMHKIDPAKYKPGTPVSALGPNEGKGEMLVAKKITP